jgi:hypothetical protein
MYQPGMDTKQPELPDTQFLTPSISRTDCLKINKNAADALPSTMFTLYREIRGSEGSTNPPFFLSTNPPTNQYSPFLKYSPREIFDRFPWVSSHRIWECLNSYESLSTLFCYDHSTPASTIVKRVHCDQTRALSCAYERSDLLIDAAPFHRSAARSRRTNAVP